MWDDAANAQKVMRERQQLDDQMSSVTKVETDLNDAIELIELGEMEDDADVVAEAEAGLADMLEMIARKQQTVKGLKTCVQRPYRPLKKSSRHLAC